MRIKKLAVKALALTLIICTALPGMGYTYACAKQKYKRELLLEGKAKKNECFDIEDRDSHSSYSIINSKLSLLIGDVVYNKKTSERYPVMFVYYALGLHKVKRKEVFRGNKEFMDDMDDWRDKKYLISGDNIRVKDGMTYGIFSKYREDTCSFENYFLCIDSKGKIKKSVSFRNYGDFKSYAEPVNADCVDFARYMTIIDYDIMDNKLYTLVAEYQREYGVDKNPLEGVKYSVQCFDMPTGKLVSSVLLHNMHYDEDRYYSSRPYSNIMKNHYVYGVRDNKLVKLSFQGKCVWESAELAEENGEVMCMDVDKSRMVYCTSKGIFEVNTQESGAVPEMIVSKKQCPELKRKKGTVYQLLIADDKRFYLVYDMTYEHNFPQRIIKYTRQ